MNAHQQRERRRAVAPTSPRTSALLLLLLTAPLTPGAALAADASESGPAPLVAVSEALEAVLPEILFHYQLLGVTLWQWLALLALAFVSALLSWLIAVAILRVLRPLAARTGTAIDDELLDSAGAPLRLALAAVVFRAGLVPLALRSDATGFINAATSALLIAAAAWLLARATDVLAQRVEHELAERRQSDAIALVTPGRKAAKVAIGALAFVAILDSFGFSVTALVAGFGVGGIAVALAAQKTIENLFGGFTLYADRPIRVGDFGRFGELLGTVEEIGMRSTRIRTLDRTLVTIPNAEFSALHIENFAARDRIRFFTMIGLRYETTPEQLRYVLVEVRRLLYSHERVTPDPARIRFVGYGAYSLDLEIFSYVDTGDWNEFMGIREDLLLRIMDIIEASGTGFAFPSQTLYLGRDEAPSEEARRRIADEVAALRERRELYLPDFPAERIAALGKTVRFPPEGSPTRTE